MNMNSAALHHDKLTWIAIARLGLIQASLGAVVVLTTSVLNRVMVIELALPALLPGLLVAMHYLVQFIRPRMGFGSDQSGRSTPWIQGGMLVLASGGVLAAIAVGLMSENLAWGIALAIVAFMMIGLGVSASGTALLVLLAKRVDEKRKAAAASCVWLMMIFGFAMTAGISGRLLDPFSFERLVLVSLSVSCIAVVLSFTALYGLEPKVSKEITPNNNQAKLRFKEALADVWQESRVRRFTIFVFISMLAYSSQDLILEPFAGTAFGLTPGETTSLSGLQHAGVLCGMLLCGFVTNKSKSPSLSSLRMWTVGGCIASALAMLSLVMSGIVGPSWPFLGTVFILGVSNGAFSIAAIGSMMQFAGVGKEKREGVRMGVWGAAQAIAFGLGGILGTGASDLARYLLGDPVAAYASVFFIEAILFMAAAILSFYIRPVERVVQIKKQNTSISGRLISHGGSS